MTSISCDVAIIGAGPAGSALATLVAREGRSVHLFEMRSFPRFQIGESLIPAANEFLAKLGVIDRMKAAGFPPKHGVQFFSNEDASRPFYFSESHNDSLHQTWQVLRSDFDMLLCDNAVEAGAVTHMEQRVTEIIRDGDEVIGLRSQGTDGMVHEVAARIVVDASGQNGVIAKDLGNRESFADLQNIAVYAHYEGAHRDAGRDAGSTVIYRIGKGAWLWFIPLPQSESIGVVAPAGSHDYKDESLQRILDSAIQSSPPLTRRLGGARRVTPVRAARDFSYRARRDGGPGWLLAGDALGFMDPVYSTGLFLSLLSADIGASTIIRALRSDSHGSDLSGWSTEWQTAFDRFLPVVRAFYRDGFRFGELARDDEKRRGMIDILIGDISTPDAVTVSRVIADRLDSMA